VAVPGPARNRHSNPDAATFAISALTIASLRPVTVPPREHPTAPKLKAELAATPALAVMLVVVLAGNLAFGGVFARRSARPRSPALRHVGLRLVARRGGWPGPWPAGAVAGTTLGAWISSRRPAVTALQRPWVAAEVSTVAAIAFKRRNGCSACRQLDRSTLFLAAQNRRSARLPILRRYIFRRR
jgi:hypothetical protein